MPVITGRTTEPIAANTLPSVTTADTIAGKNIFTARCGRCHGLPDISSYNTKKWDIILSSMIPKARLNKDQGIHLTAYIKSTCNESKLADK